MEHSFQPFFENGCNCESTLSKKQGLQTKQVLRMRKCLVFEFPHKSQAASVQRFIFWFNGMQSGLRAVSGLFLTVYSGTRGSVWVFVAVSGRVRWGVCVERRIANETLTKKSI